MYDVKLSQSQCREIALDLYDFIVLGVAEMEEEKLAENLRNENERKEVA